MPYMCKLTLGVCMLPSFCITTMHYLLHLFYYGPFSRTCGFTLELDQEYQGLDNCMQQLPLQALLTERLRGLHTSSFCP